MRKFVKLSILFVAFFALTNAVQAQKFGYVSSAAILAELPKVKQADANLEALQKQLQKKGQQMVESFQTEYTTLQQQAEAGELSPKQQEEAAKKLETEQQKIAQFEQNMQQQIMQKREELLGPILEEVNQAIKEVAEENGYQYIFEADVLLYKDPSMDISDQVKAKLQS